MSENIRTKNQVDLSKEEVNCRLLNWLTLKQIWHVIYKSEKKRVFETEHSFQGKNFYNMFQISENYFDKIMTGDKSLHLITAKLNDVCRDSGIPRGIFTGKKRLMEDYNVPEEKLDELIEDRKSSETKEEKSGKTKEANSGETKKTNSGKTEKRNRYTELMGIVDTAVKKRISEYSVMGNVERHMIQAIYYMYTNTGYDIDGKAFHRLTKQLENIDIEDVFKAETTLDTLLAYREALSVQLRITDAAIVCREELRKKGESKK